MAVKDSSNIGVWIRSERKKRRLSQFKMARFIGVTHSQLSAWELGKEIPLAEAVEEVRNFLTRFDVELSEGKITLSKRRPKREYSLSSNALRAGRKQIASNAKNGSDGQNDKGKETLSEKCLYRFFKNGDDSSSSLIRIPKDVGDKQFKGIALFAGIGGMSLGFERAGFQVIGHVEADDAVRAIYESNFPDSTCLGHDVRELSESQITHWKQLFGHVTILFGGPPCQGFSLAGKRDHHDARNQLYNEFVRVTSILQPDVIIMENVRLLTSMKTPDGSYMPDNVVKAFERVGYRCRFKELNSQDYGVPQFRERVFFLGVRNDVKMHEISFPNKTHGNAPTAALPDSPLESYRTFRDVTGDLESLESGESSNHDPWHFAALHPDHVIQWLKNVPEGESAHDNPDPTLRPPSGYNTTYKRIKWDEPCSTIGTTFGMISGSRNVHPTNTRSLTIREAMRCQTFPDDFKLFGNLGDIRTGIGNAVPPLLAQVIGHHLINTILKGDTLNIKT